MRVIRRGVFETNSSSVHSLSILTREDYETWRDNPYSVYLCDNKIYTEEEAINLLSEQYPRYSKEEIASELRDFGFENFEDYGANFETEFTPFVSPSGDQLVIVEYFGRDG